MNFVWHIILPVPLRSHAFHFSSSARSVQQPQQPLSATFWLFNIGKWYFMLSSISKKKRHAATNTQRTAREKKDTHTQRKRSRDHILCGTATKSPDENLEWMRAQRHNQSQSQSLQGIVEYNEFQHNVTVLCFWFMLSASNGQANFCRQNRKDKSVKERKRERETSHEFKLSREWTKLS